VRKEDERVSYERYRGVVVDTEGRKGRKAPQMKKLVKKRVRSAQHSLRNITEESEKGKNAAEKGLST